MSQSVKVFADWLWGPGWNSQHPHKRWIWQCEPIAPVLGKWGQDRRPPPGHGGQPVYLNLRVPSLERAQQVKTLGSQTWGPELKSSGPTLKSQCGHRRGCDSDARMDWDRRTCWLLASLQVQREALPQGNTMESYRGEDTWHRLWPPWAHSAHTHIHICPPNTLVI